MYIIGLPFPAPSSQFLVLWAIRLPERWKNSIYSKLKFQLAKFLLELLSTVVLEWRGLSRSLHLALPLFGASTLSQIPIRDEQKQ